jgi:hypothetical protein
MPYTPIDIPETHNPPSRMGIPDGCSANQAAARRTKSKMAPYSTAPSRRQPVPKNDSVGLLEKQEERTRDRICAATHIMNVRPIRDPHSLARPGSTFFGFNKSPATPNRMSTNFGIGSKYRNHFGSVAAGTSEATSVIRKLMVQES